MESDLWVPVDYLNIDDFYEYIQTLPEDQRAIELRQFSKREAKKILKEGMKESSCFYDFIKHYSHRDFKNIKGLPYVSQRVLIKHVKYWNITHPKNKINSLRIFFM